MTQGEEEEVSQNFEIEIIEDKQENVNDKKEKNTDMDKEQ